MVPLEALQRARHQRADANLDDIGAILVNINPAYQRSELDYALNKVECKALVLARTHRSSNYLGMLRDLAPELEAARPNELRAAKVPHRSPRQEQSDRGQHFRITRIMESLARVSGDIEELVAVMSGGPDEWV